MAVGVLVQFKEGSNADYDRVVEKMGLAHGRPSAGCVYHVAGEVDGGLRVVDVWESAEEFQRFAEGQIVPITQAEGFPQPDVSIWEIHNILQQPAAGEHDVGVVRGAYEAFARGDIAAVLGAVDEHVDWYSPDELPVGGRFTGAEELLGFFHRLGREYEELRVEPDEYAPLADGRLLVTGHHRGRLRGEQFEIRFAHLWTMRGGKATRFVEYADTGKLAPLFERAQS